MDEEKEKVVGLGHGGRVSVCHPGEDISLLIVSDHDRWSFHAGTLSGRSLSTPETSFSLLVSPFNK